MLSREVFHRVGWLSVLGVVLGAGNVLVVLEGVSRVVVVDGRDWGVLVVMFWSVELLFGGVDEWVHLCSGPEDVEVWDIEDLEAGHHGLCVAAWGCVVDEADDFLLCFDEWLEVSFLGIAGAPDGNVADEMGKDVGVVELLHGFE